MNDTSRESLQATVISVLSETVQDWDLDIEGGIVPSTTLIEDLAFESIDVVQFCVALEQALGRRSLPFERLFISDGAYVEDVSVAQVVDFLAQEMVAG